MENATFPLRESDHDDQIKGTPSPTQRGNACRSPRQEEPPAKKSAHQPNLPSRPPITLKHLAAALADSHEIAKKHAEAVLGDLVTLTTRHLKKGDKIRLTGLGILQVRKRAARMGRNPATGEAIKIKASKKVAFRPARELKEAV